MASTPVEFKAPTGLTLTLSLYPYGSDTIANTGGDAGTERTNAKGLYTATVTEAISGWHDAKITDGSGNLIAVGAAYLEDDTAIKRVHDPADRIWPVEDGAIPAAAADAAGGLPISDAGGLDLDAQIGTKINDIRGYLDTEVAAILAAVDTEVAAILVDTNELQTDWVNGGRLDLLIDSILADTNELQLDWVDGGRLDLILDARASQASVNTIDDFLDTEVAAILAAVDTEVAAILVDTGTDIPATLAGLFTTAMTESYSADGATATPAQALYLIMQMLTELSFSGTTGTVKKLDGSTTALTLTINSATVPTSITRST